MNDLIYNCMRCGQCCYEIKGLPGTKRIPLYPEEVDKLIELARKKQIQEFKVIEDLVFPDLKNKKILVVTYRIILDRSKTHCPFYFLDKGCIIHKDKPMACQSYPLSLKQIDAFNFQINIDPLCKYVNKHYEIIKICNLNEIKEIFNNEFPKAENFYRKNKKIMLEIKRLEIEEKIKIPRQISSESYDKALREWDRTEFRVD